VLSGALGPTEARVRYFRIARNHAGIDFRSSIETLARDGPITTAILCALASMFGFGAGFVLTQFGLRWMAPWLGVAISIPTSTLLFWCLAPFFVDPSHGNLTAVLLFACVGLFFPSAAALLNFESNRLMGPNISGALSSMTPVFAVMLAILLLGERIRGPQLLGLAAIVFGICLMYRLHVIWSARSLWLMALPLAAAAIRGVVQPIVKIGLGWWPNPIAVVVVSYTVSSVVLIVSAFARAGGTVPNIDPRGALWFAAVGLCNGLSVLAMYAALEYGPVTVISPLIAGYPLVTLLLSRVLLVKEEVGPQLIAGVSGAVCGVVLMLVA
jgi:drug/metabolite transporter (DMT)-like permease